MNTPWMIFAEVPKMKPEGWVFLALMWIGVTLLLVFCFGKVLAKKK